MIFEKDKVFLKLQDLCDLKLIRTSEEVCLRSILSGDRIYELNEERRIAASDRICGTLTIILRKVKIKSDYYEDTKISVRSRKKCQDLGEHV